MATISNITFEDFESEVRSQTGATNYSDPGSPLIMRWTNVLMNEVYLLTRAIDRAWGRNTSVLTLLKTTALIFFPAGSCSYTSATKTFAGVTGVDQTYVGGWVFFEDRSNSRGFYGLVESVSGTSVVLRFQIGTGAAANISAANMLAIFKPNPSFYNGANLGSLSVHDVVKVVDATNGNAARLKGEVFSGFSNDPSWKSSIVMEYAGESIFIDKGSSIDSHGTTTLTYNEKPDAITSASSTIDLRPEHIALLREEVCNWVRSYMVHEQKRTDISMSKVDPFAVLRDKYKKHALDTAKAMKRGT